MEPPSPLSQFISARRQELDLSLTDLAQRSHAHKSSVMRLERGEIVVPAPDLLVALAAALDVSAGELFALAGYPTVGQAPNLAACLRSQYGDLPDATLAHIEGYLEGYLSKYRPAEYNRREDKS